ncbi:hypothetical protein M5K25_009121 [Dendrobium thyrsiflorum]|uniref:Uncharacterized protein n=1 Tax=Dendrobium thyrsiflorum TaxID=117978 RepID=A0ABD0V4N3_DENTH
MLSKLGKKLNDIDPGFLPAAAGEFLLTFLFVFITVSAAMATAKMGDGKDNIAGLIVSSAANTLAVAAIVSAGFQISGAHLNPVVTLVMALGGRISLLRLLFYFVHQLLASSLACLLLRFISGGMEIPVHALASGVGSFQGLGMEMILTFSLLFTIYATIVEPGKHMGHGLGPVIVGLLVGANTLSGGLFTGASMNPARSFGPALVSWNWTNHWIYWAGPMVGGILAGFIYERFIIIRASSYVVLSTGVEGV